MILKSIFKSTRAAVVFWAILAAFGLQECGALASETGFGAEVMLDETFDSKIPFLVLDYGYEAAGLEAGGVEVSIFDGSPAGQSGRQAVFAFKAEARPAGSPDGLKKSLSLSLASGSGSDQGDLISPLGLPPARGWTLLGSDRDKSMLRTYLAFILAEKLHPGLAPKALFCEVLVKKADGLDYQGLYLFSETVEEGFLKSAEASASQTGQAGLRLTPAEKLEKNSPYRPAYISQPENPEAENRYRRLEEGLYSNRSPEFFKAESELELDSFIVTFLLFNTMMNYRRDQAPFYLFTRPDGRVGASPLWQMEASLDNAREAFEPIVTLDRLYPWFDRLLEDSLFISRLRQRYFQLSRNGWGLSDFETLIESLVERLGPALDRDWSRWKEAYQADPPENLLTEEADVRVRQTFTPTQEVLKIKHNFRMNDMVMKGFMDNLRWKEVHFTYGKRTLKNSVLTVTFVIFFFLIVGYARKRM